MNSIILQGIGEGVMGPGPSRPFFNPFTTLIVQIVIIVIALVIMWWMLRSHSQRNSFNKNDSPLDILNKRYAGGQVTREEYEQLKKDIGA